jgi:hypothetical protein
MVRSDVNGGRSAGFGGWIRDVMVSENTPTAHIAPFPPSDLFGEPCPYLDFGACLFEAQCCIASGMTRVSSSCLHEGWKGSSPMFPVLELS